jgi:exosome complex RNA-binding protein Rrp42 (RNase PH superfamily)
MCSSLSLSTGKNAGQLLDPDDRRSSSRYTLIDPNADEERLMDGFVSICMNQHKEICGIHMGGRLGLKKEQLEICKKLAFNKVLELTDRVRQVVADYYK